MVSFLPNTKYIRNYFARAPRNDVSSPKNEGEGKVLSVYTMKANSTHK